MRGQRIPIGATMVAAALALGAGACGGGGEQRTAKPKGPLAGADLARAADAVCRRHAAPHPATSTNVPFDTFAELKRPYTADARRAQAAFRELKALDVAPAARADLKNAYDTVAVIGVFDEAVARTRSAPEFGALVPRVIRAYEVALKYAAKIGSKDCPPKPESPAYLVAVKRRGGTATTTTTTTATVPPARNRPQRTAADSTSVVGRWVGTVVQYGPQSKRDRYRVEVDIRSARIGDAAGTDYYPRFDCQGELTVSSATADGSVATVRERIVKGRKRCYDVDAQIRLERVADNAVSFRWRGKTTHGSSVEVLGRLREVVIEGEG